LSPPPPPWLDFGIKTMGETGSKTSISHREGITDHPSKDTLECGWQPVIRKVQPEENNLSPHPKNKKTKRKRTNTQKKQPSLYLQLLHPGNGSLHFVYCLLLQAET
jgi:hypothetical protein